MPTYRLVPASPGPSFDLPVGRTLVIGRGLSSDIAIPDPTISRRHAEVTAGPDGVAVKDLGSSNGTCINGSRITTGRLGERDSVTFGKVLFQLEVTRGPGDLPPIPPRDAKGEARPITLAGIDAPSGTIVRKLAVSGGAPAGDAAARKLSLLLQVFQKLSGELELDRLLNMIVSVTFEVMNGDRVSILLCTGDGELVPRISRSRVGETEFEHVPRSILRKVTDERVALLTHNAATDARFKGRSILLQSVRSAMCSPLMAAGDQLVGILYVDNLTGSHAFGDEDLQFLVAFAGLAAIAIKNSNYAEQIRREAVVRSNFERYFAPNVAADIAQQQAAIRLGGEKRPITVLFSDIRNFTTIAEQMGPDAIAALLTDYFTEMVDVVFEHGGTLDKFIGDAIMALWGAPIAREDDPKRALEAAVALQKAVDSLNSRWVQARRPRIGVGIGINHGEVFVGNIGSHRRLEYTVIGDAVNVAQRLSTLAAPGEILVSEALYHAVGQPSDAEHLPSMALKGKRKVVEVYRVRRESKR
ncbi:MAG TPA: adenylate/guanylate cyclase domain-containing protein [Gemmatimonadales bacterium]|nr:adenylate/guanylate cyclase domain-containing protein [Gemmatimonadales bacterium]